MLKKVILQTMFGEPFADDWLQKYFANVNMLEKYGWYWKVFTPNKIKSRGNVEIISMTLEEFDQRIKQSCGVDPRNYLENGRPHKFVSDYYPAYGLIFQDYIKDFDFWGHTNWDVVYGRLDHFIPDDFLKACDIFADESNEINGVFTVYRNNNYINNLFREVPAWEHMFTVHELFTFDENHMTKLVQRLASEGKIKFKYPTPYPFFSYDRLPQHIPSPQLVVAPDGSLFETYTDIVTGRKIGKEMSFFHFSYTKKYPQVREVGGV